MSKDINWLDIVIGLGLIFPAALWGGYVASTLWGWFLVPSLGVPQLGTVAASGMILMVSFMHPFTTEASENESDWPLTSKLFGSGLVALIVLGLGAIFNLWM